MVIFTAKIYPRYISDTQCFVVKLPKSRVKLRNSIAPVLSHDFKGLKLRNGRALPPFLGLHSFTVYSIKYQRYENEETEHLVRELWHDWILILSDELCTFGQKIRGSLS